MVAAATAALRGPWCRVHGHRFKNTIKELFVLMSPLFPMALSTALCIAHLLLPLPPRAKHVLRGFRMARGLRVHFCLCLWRSCYAFCVCCRSARFGHAAFVVAIGIPTAALRVLQSLISQQSYFVMPPKFQSHLYDHKLLLKDCAAIMQYGIQPRESCLIGYTEDEVRDHIMAPIENLQCQGLRDHGRPDLVPLVPRYDAFLILLGMVRPMRVDGVWDRKGLSYNPYMGSMLTRRQYYLMQQLLRTDAVLLLEDGNGQWAGEWCMAGGALAMRPWYPTRDC